jgi:hypothetical protein
MLPWIPKSKLFKFEIREPILSLYYYNFNFLATPNSVMARMKGNKTGKSKNESNRLPVTRGRGKSRDFGNMTDKQFLQMDAPGKKGSQADELVALGEPGMYRWWAFKAPALY